MTDRLPLDREQRLANLAIDPDVLARELEAEEVGDPFDDIDIDDPEQDALNAIRQCDEALSWLQQGHEQRLQGLRVFCEHRDPRSVPAASASVRGGLPGSAHERCVRPRP